MTDPITPATAATPGSGEQVPTPATAPVGEKKEGVEGTVTISTKEYANLNRNTARLTSLQKRPPVKTAVAPVGGENSDVDPEIVRQMNDTNARNKQLERDIMQRDVREKVREILDKDIYKDLPASTKKMILKNPSSLSKADNLDEAILDIEDFINESLDDMAKVPAAETTTPPTTVETKHETPAPVSTGAAPTTEQALEKTEGLRGPSRSKAILRNVIRKQVQGVKE